MSEKNNAANITRQYHIEIRHNMRTALPNFYRNFNFPMVSMAQTTKVAFIMIVCAYLVKSWFSESWFKDSQFNESRFNEIRRFIEQMPAPWNHFTIVNSIRFSELHNLVNKSCLTGLFIKSRLGSIQLFVLLIF